MLLKQRNHKANHAPEPDTDIVEIICPPLIKILMLIQINF